MQESENKDLRPQYQSVKDLSEYRCYRVWVTAPLTFTWLSLGKQRICKLWRYCSQWTKSSKDAYWGLLLMVGKLWGQYDEILTSKEIIFVKKAHQQCEVRQPWKTWMTLEGNDTRQVEMITIYVECIGLSLRDKRLFGVGRKGNLSGRSIFELSTEKGCSRPQMA